MDKKIIERVLQNSVILDQVHETVKKLDAKLDGLDHIIRGNGSPGITQKVEVIKLKVEQLESGHSRWRDACFTAIGGIVVGIAVFLFSESWSAHHGTPSMSPVQSVGQRP